MPIKEFLRKAKAIDAIVPHNPEDIANPKETLRTINAIDAHQNPAAYKRFMGIGRTPKSERAIKDERERQRYLSAVRLIEDAKTRVRAALNKSS